MNAMRFVGWDVLLTWFGIYTIFFLSVFFLCRMRIEFLSVSRLSVFSPLLTGDSISLSSSSSFQLSKWTNQSPLTSLFFLLARSPRALSFLVSVASPSSSSSSAFFSLVDAPMHAPIHPFRVFFLFRCLFFSRCHPPRTLTYTQKKTRASANAVDERPKRARE